MESKLKLNFFQIHFFLFCYEADREALILQHTMRPINISMFWSPWSLAVVTSLTLIYSYTGPSFVQGSSNPGNIKTHRPPECVKCDQFPVCVLILKDVSGPTTVLLSPLLACSQSSHSNCHYPGEACWWTVHPASKQRSEGEKVRVGDDVIFVSVATERYLVCNDFYQGKPSK